jgi:hypothetical protein
LFDLKYDPSILEIPIPRYYKEDDRIPVDIDMNEKVEREEEGKKKGKKKKKKKKKGKKDDDEDKPKLPPPMPLDEKNQLMDKLIEQYWGTNDAE